MQQQKIYCACFKSSVEGVPEACLMLHGFPANLPEDPRWEKNQDIGQSIAQALCIDVHLNHYQGLGKSLGSFSFEKSITDSLQLAESLLKKYPVLHIIGHSWGAVVAVNVVKVLKNFNGRLILLSPFNKIPDDDTLERTLEGLCRDVPIKFESGSVAGAVADLRNIANKGDPRAIVQLLDLKNKQVTIIQSIEDDEVPVDTTREFLNFFAHKPEYIEFDSNHKFSKNRDQLTSLIISKLGASYVEALV